MQRRFIVGTGNWQILMRGCAKIWGLMMMRCARFYHVRR
tara:strand:- start:1259 stop:1375 length:117 start_codon:yes stop_codon:yes gene_type:complete